MLASLAWHIDLMGRPPRLERRGLASSPTDQPTDRQTDHAGGRMCVLIQGAAASLDTMTNGSTGDASAEDGVELVVVVMRFERLEVEVVLLPTDEHIENVSLIRPVHICMHLPVHPRAGKRKGGILD